MVAFQSCILHCGLDLEVDTVNKPGMCTTSILVVMYVARFCLGLQMHQAMFTSLAAGSIEVVRVVL
jgi:hypothetical protein